MAYSISCKGGLVVMNFLCFFCLRKSISPSFLKDSIAEYSILGWQFFLQYSERLCHRLGFLIRLLAVL